MKTHNILLRQLKRFNLSEQECPKTEEQWQRFLDRINRTYLDFDQNRLMNNRAQEISTREQQELYDNLEQAENIAHIGSWIDDLKNNRTRGSAEADHIIGVDRSLKPFTLEDLFTIIHPADRDAYKETIQNAIQRGINFEQEIRIQVADAIRWVHICGRPIFNAKDHRVEKLQGTIMDITEDKLAKQRKEMEHNVLRMLVGSKPLGEMIKQVLQIICETFEWKLGVFWVWDEQKQLFIRQQIWGENAEVIKTYLESIPEVTASPHSHFLMQKIWKTHKPYWIDLTKENVAGYNQLRQRLGIQSAFGFPILTQKEPILVLEVLDFFSASNKNIDDLDIASINSISNQLGLFVEKRRAQEHEISLNQELIAAARRAGMAEVATSVLHNVGNILNSVNVSVNLLREKLEHSTLLAGFVEINQQLKEHEKDFKHYITENPRGQKLPTYLNLFEKAFTEERIDVADEIGSLNKNIQHIKEVIAAQQALSGTVGTVEPTSIPAEIEDAIGIVGFNANYTIERLYEYEKQVPLDKTKLMQIMVNLVRNAKDALMESTQEKKILTLSVKQKSSNTLQIKVIDNGVGIEPENISRIFSFGFTTKKTGHGFGLHASTILAKELGGCLLVESNGRDKGSVFTLELPINLLKTA